VFGNDVFQVDQGIPLPCRAYRIPFATPFNLIVDDGSIFRPSSSSSFSSVRSVAPSWRPLHALKMWKTSYWSLSDFYGYPTR